ncbi:hypothetical protein J6500_07075 [Bradyrhizobium sp. WSM 1704]|uniref:hypothetical protein n=1 Tax=Bradyrhizobium semiaridum TaxID=2821404 RepID=UPI001CE3AC93|nr:hypothetical protein [Bradyrhizobium semiaridum]MCA6121664.1 hypothetical protein [Bradyrhizobium semiaridum]
MTKRYNILTRCLAAVALLFVYVASTSAILVGATTSPAQAYRGRGGWGYRGGGWGYRGGYRGRGFYPRGYGFYAPGPRCWWTPRGVRVCRW